MLFYVATYPRSGNAMLRSMLAANLGIQNSAGMNVQDLNPTERKRLAAVKTRYFVKTHDLPYPEFFDGERVIQLVRHPGACLWSYFRMLVDHQIPRMQNQVLRRAPLTIEAVTAGNAPQGDWSAYTNAWTAAGERLGTNFLRMRYEDVLSDHMAALRKIVDLTVSRGGQRIDILSDAPPNFELYRSRRPNMGLRGVSEGYEPFYTRRQLEALWSAHGALAETFGYTPPDFDAAGSQDAQIDRLLVVIAAMSKRGQELEAAHQGLLDRLRATSPLAMAAE